MPEDRDFITDFYATTLTSVYHVRAKDPLYPTAEKIALRGKSEVGVGGKLQKGTMLAVCDQLILYIPEGGGYTSFERRIEKVNSRYWGENSSPIVGLFLTATEAVDCLASADLQPADTRWLSETKNVLEVIGDDHPCIYVCHHPGLSLLPAA